jgi:OmpA-OmpF porin, OOP family
VKRCLLVLLSVGVACATGPSLRERLQQRKAAVEQSRRLGALKCAPAELATAEAQLDFADHALLFGDTLAAQTHLLRVDDNVKRAAALSKVCRPKKVVVKEPSLVVKLDDADRDGDTVNDVDDLCPLLAGPKENDGCPKEAPQDRDADGVLDAADRCPTEAEDKDGFQDDDGCPDLDNDSDGLTDALDQCPNQKGPTSTNGCPVTDQDRDGVGDDADKCPNEPEDKDGFQDDDGCPDLDNDSDGIPDAQDKCADIAEDKDGFQDDDGCPDPDNDGDQIADALDECPMVPGLAENKGCPKKYSFLTVTRDRLEIKKQIQFAVGSAAIVGAQSKLVLKDVAAALKDSPRIKKLRIEGHTDSNGDDLKNLKLSESRAKSVLIALINLGVENARLEAVGFGETKPVATNATSAGRAQNRRTDFNITEQ